MNALVGIVVFMIGGICGFICAVFCFAASRGDEELERTRLLLEIADMKRELESLRRENASFREIDGSVSFLRRQA
jgi:cell shape-determining protein MreC